MAPAISILGKLSQETHSLRNLKRTMPTSMITIDIRMYRIHLCDYTETEMYYKVLLETQIDRVDILFLTSAIHIKIFCVHVKHQGL